MARVAPLRATLLAAVISVVAGVQQPDVEAFLRSAQGLAMTPQDAAALASKETRTLTACGVTVPMLQALKDAMYSVSMLNMGLAEVRQNLLPLAYQHVSPAALNALFQTLRSPSGLGLLVFDATAKALQLGKQKAEPYLLGPLYQVLYSFSGVNLPRTQAAQWALNLAVAGASAEKLRASYLDKKSRMSQDAALAAAISDAVDANLFCVEARYAKDGKPYVAREFQTHYGTQWLAEWLAAPQEKRTAQDGKDYLAAEFMAHYGDSWIIRWAASGVAEQRRIAKDGRTYAMAEFLQYYGDSWQSEWAQSYEVLDICAGLDHASCEAQPFKCQWSWTGDWTTSCVVNPLTSLVV
jgi:hypothetical protein